MPAGGAMSGGGSGRDIKVAGAYWEVFAKDKMSPVLEKLKAKTKEVGEAMKATAKASAMAFGGAFLGSIVSSKVVDEFEKLGKELADMATGADKVAERFEKASRELKTFVELAERAADINAEFREGMNPADAAGSLAADIDRLTAQAQALRAEAAAEANRRRPLAEEGGFGGWFGRRTGMFDARIEGSKKREEELIAAADKLGERLAKLRREQFLAENPDLDPKKLKIADGLADAAERQMVALTRSADELREFDLKKMGLSAAQVEKVMAAEAPVNALLAQREASMRALQSLPSAAVAATAVKGAFQTFGAAGMFGFGGANSEAKKQTDLQNQLVALMSLLPNKIGDQIVESFRPK